MVRPLPDRRDVGGRCLLDAFEAHGDADRVADQVFFEQVGHLIIAALELVLAMKSGTVIFAISASSFAEHSQVELNLARYAVDRECADESKDLATLRRVNIFAVTGFEGDIGKLLHVEEVG